MSDKTDEWVENLGVTWFKADNPPGNSQPKKESGPPPGMIVMDPPIGLMRFDSVSAGDSKRQVFTVSVPHSDKESLLFKAAAEGRSVGTVKIGLQGMVITLTDVQISSFQATDSGLVMVLNSSKPAEISEE
jgi:hypothetical protein